METVLLAVTVVSLLVAFIMSAAAWRVSRDERARSAARIAALAAAAGDESAASAQHAAFAPHAVTAQHAVSAPHAVAAPQPLVVNQTRASAPWAPARVPQFRAESLEPWVKHPVAASTPHAEATHSLGESFLGSAVSTPPSSGRQRGLAIAAGLLLLAILTGGYFAMSSDDASAVKTAADATTSPLELVSLRHERRGGTLAITGLVRNPGNGAPVDKLTAVAFLFDPQGGLITSARADVDFTRLGPGDESPFVIALDAPSNVARYRVSFRNDAGVIAHVDRRGQEPIARGTP
jgi:hypothetical protein